MLNPIVVVPDGISVIDNKIYPSFVYRAVLEKAAEIWKPNQTIYLAPANHFGFEKTEQALGGEFLKKNYPKVDVSVIPTDEIWQKNYVDTYMNAVMTHTFFLDNEIDDEIPIILVVGKIHARRAVLAFEKAFFLIEKVIEVDYPDCAKDEKIVRRLFYYNYRWLHKIYEFLAFWRDKLIY